MTATTARLISHWRPIAWGTVALLLLLPLIAMQFTDEVNWTPTDFIFMAALLGGALAGFDLAVRKSGSLAYRAGAAVALATTFFLIWINAAVGIVGNENHPANAVFAGVLAVAVIGAALARFRPRGMARALLATAITQAAVALLVAAAGWGLEAFVLSGFFTAAWLTSAWLFGVAAREARPA